MFAHRPGRPEDLSIYVDKLQLSETPGTEGFSQWAYAESSSLFRAAALKVQYKKLDFALYWGLVNCRSICLTGSRALQVEVDESDYDNLKRALMLIYNRTKIFALGIKLVYVPPPCADESLQFQACASHANFLSKTYDHRFFRKRTWINCFPHK